MKEAEQPEFDPKRLWLTDEDRRWLAGRAAKDRLRLAESLVLFRRNELIIKELDVIAVQLLVAHPGLPVRARFVLELWRRQAEECGRPHHVLNRTAQIVGRRWRAHGLKQCSRTRRSPGLDPILGETWRSIPLAPPLQSWLARQGEPPPTSPTTNPEGEPLL